MNLKHPFKWLHFQLDVILLNVQWYCRYAFYRDLEEMMREWGVEVELSTLYRWVQRYALEINKRCRPHLRPTKRFWRVNETYIQVEGKWKYLYRLDSAGNTLDFLLSRTLARIV